MQSLANAWRQMRAARLSEYLATAEMRAEFCRDGHRHGDVTREFSDGDANRPALTNVTFHLIFLRVN